jgi:transcriptional regulator with XRE-family HTH domain
MDDLGAQLRAAREAEGVSLSKIAARAHYSKSHLSNVESGRREPTAAVILAYAKVLGEDCMQRRGLLMAAAAGVVAPAAAGELIHSGFSAALRRRDADERWRNQVIGYGRDYMAVGAGQLQTRLAGDLVVLQQQLDTPSMWASASRLLAVYGKTTGEPAEAIRWYRLAVEAADRSGDLPVRVWVRGRAAIALAYEGASLGVAAQLAEQADQLSDKPSIGRLNALVAKAHVAAGRGDLTAAIAADEAARRVFDPIASPDAEVSDFAVPPWRMATFRSMLWARLGQVRRAEQAQAEADDGRPPQLQRFATHIELHRGLMMAHAGDGPAGLAYARAAMDALPQERRSQTLRLVLAEVERAAAVKR